MNVVLGTLDPVMFTSQCWIFCFSRHLTWWDLKSQLCHACVGGGSDISSDPFQGPVHEWLRDNQSLGQRLYTESEVSLLTPCQPWLPRLLPLVPLAKEMGAFPSECYLLPHPTGLWLTSGKATGIRPVPLASSKLLLPSKNGPAFTHSPEPSDLCCFVFWPEFMVVICRRLSLLRV